MSSTATTSSLAQHLRSAAPQIANNLGNWQLCPNPEGSADNLVRSRKPFDTAMTVVRLCAATIEATPESDAYVRSQLDTWEAWGARLALQGIPVTEVIEWLRRLERAVGDHLLDCDSADRTEVRLAIERIGALFDTLCTREIDSYTSTYDDLSHWHARTGIDLITYLASGAPVEPHTVNGHARILGINPHQRFRAVAVYQDGSPTAAQWVWVRRRILDLFARHDFSRDSLLRDRPGILLAVLPVDRPGPTLPEALANLLADSELAESLFVALGEPVDSLAAAGRSCRQALSALEISIHRGQRGRVVQCTDVILEVLLAHNRWVCNRIVSVRLAPLLERPHLLDTLRAYINAEMSLQRTAELLVVHPNTVAYRLRQISALTGRDMRCLTDMADLIVGITALDVLEMQRNDRNRIDLRSYLLN